MFIFNYGRYIIILARLDWFTDNLYEFCIEKFIIRLALIIFVLESKPQFDVKIIMHRKFVLYLRDFRLGILVLYFATWSLSAWFFQLLLFSF